MKLVNLLSKKIILEVSEKVVKQLLDKYKKDTTDSDEEIRTNINMFDKYKSGLPADKRDIFKYSYDELKSLVKSKERVKGLESIYTDFKKREESIERIPLKRNIKKFLEIKSALPEKYQDINKYKYLELVELNNKAYAKVLTDLLLKKFSKENPEINNDQILYYIETYIDNFDQIPIETKGVNEMSFTELEHLLDSIEISTDKVEKKENFSDIDLVYDDNNLKIFSPLTKDQCIRLKNGRSWCTSREGGGNMYYNYRLGHERTLYYVIDEDQNFNDLNYAVVILVDPDGQKSLADKSNSGRYSGSINLPWDEIVKKVPKLEGLEGYFKAKPLTMEEKEQINRIKDARVSDDVMKSFKSHNDAEMWLEYKSPTLNDKQYSSLTPDLKKKYIALGMELAPQMVSASEPEVLKYYISRKIENIKNSNLDNLSMSEIALLNTPLLKVLKEELKSKFGKSLAIKGGTEFVIDGLSKGAPGKFIALYGLDEIFKNLPETLDSITIKNTDDNTIVIKIPNEIKQFSNLESISFEKCIDELPDAICELPKLRFLTLKDNQLLTKIPECIGNMSSLVFLNLMGSTNAVVPNSIKEKGNDYGDGFWDLGEI